MAATERVVPAHAEESLPVHLLDSAQRDVGSDAGHALPGPDPDDVSTPELTKLRQQEAQEINQRVAEDLTQQAVVATSPAAGRERQADDAASNRSQPSLRVSVSPSGKHTRMGSVLSMSGVGSPRHTNILEEDPHLDTLDVDRGEMAKAAAEAIKSDEVQVTLGLNMRDICDTSPETIRSGLVFRSSQVFSRNELVDLRITSALDLREEPGACKKAAENSVMTGVAVAPLQLLPDRLKLHVHRSLPVPCSVCSGRCSEEASTSVKRDPSSSRPNLYKASIQVFHVDMLPARVKLQIFVDMPWRIRLKTIAAPLHGKSPQQVMTPAVADPAKLGYLKLYKMMLDMSMRPIARALRVFAYEENFPVVVHCIHGKDRTGLIIALLLLTLGVPEPVVVLDYAKSEVELKGGREKGAVKGELKDWLVTDDVIASSAQTMEDTLRYLDSRYGGIRKYLRILGITRREVHQIRQNLLVPRGDGANPELLSTFSMGSFDEPVAAT